MRYGSRDLNLEAFLGSRGSTASGLTPTDSCLGSSPRICLRSIPTHLHRIPKTGLSTILRPFFAQSHKYRIINPFPISYAFQPRLRGRLTPGRLPLPGKPWVYGERVFHPFYRYSCQHNHFSTVHRALRLRLQPVKNAPLPDRLRGIRSFGIMLSPVTFSAQRH